jgi:radical SAM superfamily enzyme YgiQ (UPF0313 family)
MANCIILNEGTFVPDQRPKINRTLGAYRVASALEDAGYSTFVLDFISGFTMDEIIQAVALNLDKDTLWVGFSSTFFWPEVTYTNVKNARTLDHSLDQMYFTRYSEVKRLIDYVKNNSTAKLIYGGARSPFYRFDNNIDYYVAGYADNAVIDITNYIAGRVEKLHSVQEIEIDGKTCLSVDSANYPEPTMDNISTHWWNKDFNILPGEGLPMEMARGCIFKCKFCSFQLTGKKKGTYLRDIEECRDELIRTWEAHGTTNYYITDDTFNDDNDKIEALHRLFTSLPFKPTFTCYLRIDLLNHYPHQAQLLADMGMIGCFFGIETLHPKSAVSIGKGLHPNKVKDRLYWLGEQWKNRVNMDANMILGLPYDDHAYFYDLISWATAKDNPVQNVQFSPLMLFHYGKDRPEFDKYSSEFSLNPEIYGYQLPPGNASGWTLPSQKLTYKQCLAIADSYNEIRKPMNKISSFYMTTALNIGITLEDLYSLTELEIKQKYNIPAMNEQRVTEYKRLIGI